MENLSFYNGGRCDVIVMLVFKIAKVWEKKYDKKFYTSALFFSIGNCCRFIFVVHCVPSFNFIRLMFSNKKLNIVKVSRKFSTFYLNLSLKFLFFFLLGIKGNSHLMNGKIFIFFHSLSKA
jgi:hypothetical protein